METMVGIHTSLPRIRELENEMAIVKFLVKASRILVWTACSCPDKAEYDSNQKFEAFFKYGLVQDFNMQGCEDMSLIWSSLTDYRVLCVYKCKQEEVWCISYGLEPVILAF